MPLPPHVKKHRAIFWNRKEKCFQSSYQLTSPQPDGTRRAVRSDAIFRIRMIFFLSLKQVRLYWSTVSLWMYFSSEELGFWWVCFLFICPMSNWLLKYIFRAFLGRCLTLFHFLLLPVGYLVHLGRIPEEQLTLRKNHSFMNMEEGKSTEFHHHVKYLISCFLWPGARGFGLPTTIFSNKMNQMFEAFRNFERVMYPPPPWASWFTKPPSKKKKKFQSSTYSWTLFLYEQLWELRVPVTPTPPSMVRLTAAS